jgi:hypothetical protein
MPLVVAITIIVLLDLALIAGLALVMSSPRKLRDIT